MGCQRRRKETPNACDVVPAGGGWSDGSSTRVAAQLGALEVRGTVAARARSVMAAPSALQKAMQLSERTVIVAEVPPEVCTSGAADVQIAALFQEFGDVIAVCLHPPQQDPVGWGTVTFAEPGEATSAICAASVSVEVAATPERGPRTAMLPVQRATLAMESRALAAMQLGGRGPAPVRRRGHASFRTAGQHVDECAPLSRDRASDAQNADRSALIRDAIMDSVGDAYNSTEHAAWDRAVDRLVTDVQSSLWSAMQTLRKAPRERSQRDVSAIVTMARHQQIGFVTKLTGPEQRRICAVLRLQVVPTGHELYCEGSAADAMYIILHGAATATTQQGGGGPNRIAQLRMQQAESEEDSDDEDRNTSKGVLASQNADTRDERLSPRESDVPTELLPPTAVLIRSEERKLGDYCNGQHFGELALLKPGSTRTATVVIREPSILLRLNQADFASAMRVEDEEQARVETAISRLRKCPIFQDLPLRVLLDLTELAEHRYFPKDTVLYEQGSPATEMSLVLSGKVVVSAKIRRREISPPRPRSSISTESRMSNSKKSQCRTRESRRSDTAEFTAITANLLPSSSNTSPAPTKLSPAAPEAGYWCVRAGNLGAGAIVGSEGLPPDNTDSPRTNSEVCQQAVQRHRWTTTATNDVEVLQLRVHTLLHRTSPLVLERLQEYRRAELSQQSLEKAVGREHQWQQMRSELFVHITGKGQTQREAELKEMWAGRAAKVSLTGASMSRRETKTNHDTVRLSFQTVSTLRKRSQSINTTGQRHKQEVRWIEQLKERTARMTERREAWRDDRLLQKTALKTDWAQAHQDFVETVSLYDQLTRTHWDPMTCAVAPANLETTSTHGLLDGSKRATPRTTRKLIPSDTKEILLNNLTVNSALYSVAFENTLILCGSVGCADTVTQKSAGFGYLSWLYWVESLLERFEQQLEDEGMHEHFKLVREGGEGFKIMAMPAPMAATYTSSTAGAASDTKNSDDFGDAKTGLRGDSTVPRTSSFVSQVSVESTSTGSSMNEASRVPAGAVSLAWLADRLVQFGIWMLDEAKAMNDKADRVDRTVMMK